MQVETPVHPDVAAAYDEVLARTGREPIRLEAIADGQKPSENPLVATVGLEAYRETVAVALNIIYGREPTDEELVIHLWAPEHEYRGVPVYVRGN